MIVGVLGVMLVRVTRFQKGWEALQPWFWAFAALGLVPMIAGLLPGRADIGADGFLFRWLGVRRYIRARDVSRIVAVAKPSGVRIDSKNGSSLTIPMAPVGGPKPESFADQLRAAMKEAHTENVEEVLLADRAAGVRDWVRRLRALATDGSFRSMALSAERLWEVIENPGARPEARFAAAVALGPLLDADGRARIRIATQAIAAPHLRVAVEAAVAEEPDSAELERLLKLVE
jgi:hypothetical protein